MHSSPAPYYLVSLNPPPSLVRAFTNRRENYIWNFTSNRPNMFEINYLQEGSISEMREDGEHTYPQGSVHTMVDNRTVTKYSKDPFLHEFFLRIVLQEAPIPISEDQAANWFSTAHQAILPEVITDPALCEQIGNMIKSVVGLAFSDYVCRGLKLRAVMYEILTLLTQYAVEQARKNQQMPEKKRSRYTIKAIQYINTHINERIRVADIAKAAGDNYDHLKRVFLADTNMTLVEYINRTRIRTVEQLITVENMTLEQAGAAVGICDVKYLSRMFHRYTGMTAREFRHIYSERWNRGE